MTTLAIAAATFAAGMAAMYVPARLARYDARMYDALAEEKLTECEARDAAFEETRNKPWHYAAFASAPADPDVTGEVVAVEETGLTFVVGEDGPVLLALSDLPHHDDEDAPHDDTDRPRWWAIVAAFTVLAPVAFVRRQWPVLVEWAAYRFKSQAARDAEFAESYHRALEQARDEQPAVEPEPVQIAPRNHRYLPTGAYPLVKVTGAAPGRHRAEPDMPAINPSIPTQRTDGDL